MITASIVHGPSRRQLMESFCRHCSGAQTNVMFVTEDGLRFVGSIVSLGYEDDSGYLFNFGGYFDGKHLEGWFNARTRKGYIKLLLPN